jgi:uncharacterized coiled-coil DUF342 family protein
MGSLKGMLQFLGQAQDTLEGISGKLDKIQEYFNNNFSNVSMIRESEIDFLQKEFFSDSGSFHEKIRSGFTTEIKKQEEKYRENIEELRKDLKKFQEEMESTDEKRVALLKKIKRSNRSLDKKEEKLKDDIAVCEKRINKYNKKIDELNTGFGFVLNLFKMKKLENEKEELIDTRDEFVESIEDIRSKWEEKTGAFEETEKEIRSSWNGAQVKLSMIKEKIDYIRKNREEIIKKAAFTGTLSSLKGDEDFLMKKIDPEKPAKCKRCGSENRENRFFCFYCGERFAGDRPDIDGSLIEIGELNEVYNKLLEGVKSSVSFLALMKGLTKGVKEFIKSVRSVKDSQDKYPSLPNLDINVPDFTLKFYNLMKELESKINVEFFNLHPAEFSHSLEEYEKKVFTDKNIEKFFSKMGDELNSTTREQWG